MTAVLLIDPKYPHNVGGALRACACWGAAELVWTGERVLSPDEWPRGARLPREERLRLYRQVSLHRVAPSEGPPEFPSATPVCVERSRQAESLFEFTHPESAVYVFGPEDGSVPKGVRHWCHRFVTIPTANNGPLNLAAAVNVVLYDRASKAGES